MIPELRNAFNQSYSPARYAALLDSLEQRCGARVEFRNAETPIFLPLALLEQMAQAGAELTASLLANTAYLAAARQAIPAGYCAAGASPHPNFLTADFALIRNPEGQLEPRLVEIQGFPSVYGYQAALCAAWRDTYPLNAGLKTFLGGLDEEAYWKLLAETVLRGHDPERVVLTELDPRNQKTWPDFAVTARRLGIAVVDIRALVAVGDKLHYRSEARDRNRGGPNRLVPIDRIYNRAIADELAAQSIQLPFDLTRPWDVEWAGHPNWYFLISKFSIPWLEQPVVPPAAFVGDFLRGPGRARLASAGVRLPPHSGPGTIYSQLLLKPLFSFAGKGIRFDPAQEELEAISPQLRGEFLLQQRMHFEPTIETPFGLTQAEIRILYLWPDAGSLTPVLPLVRLGRGKMMGVDHNRDQQWVGATAAFYPA
ncbi:MAG: hypothetical protein ACRD3N_14335 [Terracidiphilus sp.]